jgi:hypothetical protein
MAAEIGFDWWHRSMLIALADAKLELGRVDEAEPDARATLSLTRELGDRRGMIWGLVLLARAAAARGDASRAGRFWGVVEAEHERRPIGQWERERDLYSERIGSGFGPEFARAREQGRQLSLEQAVEEALAA